MQKFSNTTENQIEDEEIEEDIKYEGKFDLINDGIDDENDNDEFIESISKKLLLNLTLVGHNTDDYKFDAFIEKLQDIVIEEEFEVMQEEFFSKNCHEFEDMEENKLSYTKIFKDYTKMTESYIEKVRQKNNKNRILKRDFRIINLMSFINYLKIELI